MRDTYGVVMFATGFIGLILTYYLSSIANSVAQDTNGTPPMDSITALFYVFSAALALGGVFNSRRMK